VLLSSPQELLKLNEELKEARDPKIRKIANT
jgi:hypothetical protein